MESGDTRRRDLQTVRAIARGPGNYATPSPERIERLLQQGLIKKKKKRLVATLKGRVLAWWSRHDG